MVIPVSLASYFVVFAISNLYFTYTRSYDQEPGTGNLFNLIAPGLAGLIGTYACLRIGGFIAPKAKSVVAFLLMMVMCGFIGISIYIMVTKGFKYTILLEVIGTTVGSFWGLFSVKNKEEEEELA